MKNSFNILAILILLACVNSNKLISYSDIVTSLVELNDDREQALSHVVNIVENFGNSNNLLSSLKGKLNENCDILNKRGTEQQTFISNKIASHKATISILTEENKKITPSLLNDESSVKAEVKSIKENKKEIESAEQEILNNEKAIYESVNVLKRLKNLAIDELQGTSQKSTEMNKFNVTVITPPAFVQFSDFHGELRSLLSKSDSVNRGFISTLIMLTQSAGKQTFSNPEAVKKIIAMIDKVLANSYAKIQEIQKIAQEKISSYSAIIINSRELILKLKQEIEKKISNRASNENSITFYSVDIISLEKALSRRQKRLAFSLSLCKKQTELIDGHYQKYVESLNQINELKISLNSEIA